MTEETRMILEKLEELSDRMTEMDHKINLVQKETAKTRVIMENEISQKIDVIGDGHDFLKQRLEKAMNMEVKREGMELELINLRMEVNKIKEHSDTA